MLNNVIPTRFKPYPLFLVLTTLMVTFGVHGFEHGAVNNFRDQSVQLPIIYSYADHGLFPGDFLVSARSHYVTFFYPMLGLASRIVPLHWLMLSLYIVATGITLTACYLLGESLYPRRGVGIGAMILYLAYFPNLGGDYTHSPFVTHTTFAVSLQLLALALIFRKKPLWAAFLLGLAANINAMTSLFVTAAWASALLGRMFQPVSLPASETPRRFHLRADLSFKSFWQRYWVEEKLLLVPIVMGFAAAPVIYWRLSLLDVPTQAPLNDYVSIMRLRLWYAVFPFSVDPMLYLLMGLITATWLYSFRYGKPRQHGQVLWMMGGILTLCLIGTIFTEVFPVEFVIQLQLIRSSWLLNYFILFYLANMAGALLRRSPQHVLAAFGLVSALAAARWVLGLFPTTHPTPYRLLVDFNNPWTANLQPVLFGLLMLPLLWSVWNIQRHHTPRYAHRFVLWFAFAIAIFTGPMFLDSTIPTSQIKTAENWADVQRWIRYHTRQDATFITPPQLDGFRIGAQRTQLGDWKDGTVGIFDEAWVVEWRTRMVDMGLDETTFAFRPLNQAQLCYVAGKYAMDYAVVFNSWDIAGEAVYTNDSFSVYPVVALDCRVEY